MRRLLLSAALAASLSGCASVGGISPTAGSFIDQVRAATSAACAFLPTAETVANILATGNPLVSTASTIADAICNAVKPKLVSGKLRRATAPSVLGVPVHGKFLTR